MGGAFFAFSSVLSAVSSQGAGMMTIAVLVHRLTTRTRRRVSTTTERKVDVKDLFAFSRFLASNVRFLLPLANYRTDTASFAVYSPLFHLPSSPLFLFRSLSLSSLLFPRLSVPLSVVEIKSRLSCVLSLRRYERGKEQKISRATRLDEKLLKNRETRSLATAHSETEESSGKQRT